MAKREANAQRLHLDKLGENYLRNRLELGLVQLLLHCWLPGSAPLKQIDVTLWPGGELLYAMTADGPEQVEFMKRAGMPLATQTRGTYDEIVKHRRLAFRQLADFVPGVAPYDVATLVELHPTAQGVRMVLTFDAMHDEQWTKMAEMGWRSELDKMERALAARRQAETK